MSHRIILPRIVEIGKGASYQAPTVLETLNVSKPLIVTDKTMLQLGYAERLSTALREKNVETTTFSDTVQEPTASSIEAGVEMVREGEFDSIIALGGGSPIDSAKAISIVGKFGGAIRDYKFPREVSEAGLPIIAIPTTAGTGSESTRVTVITDDEKGEKMMCAGFGLVPTAALIDYELTLSLPPRVTADCGLDALTHAMEAYVSKKQNPFTSLQAISALRLIGKNLRRVYHEPSNTVAREEMMLGSSLAGLAFSNSSVALVHGMSRPIGAFFHVPHGLSNAMLLPVVTEFSLLGSEGRYADCARALGLGEYEDNGAACRKLVEELWAINEEMQVPTPSSYGIDEKRFESLIPTMAEQAQASGSPSNNPRAPTFEEITELYRRVWQGQGMKTF